MPTSLDRNGRVTRYDYEFHYDGGSNYRLTSEEWYVDAADTTADYALAWNYTVEGYLDTAKTYDGDATTGTLLTSLDYGYDTQGRIVTIESDGPHTPAVKLTQTWDDRNRRTRRGGMLVGAMLASRQQGKHAECMFESRKRSAKCIWTESGVVGGCCDFR